MLYLILTTSAVAVFRHLIAKRVCAKMRDLAKELDRRLGVAVLKLSIGRAHATKRLNLAAVADRRTRPRLIANFPQRTFPAFCEAALSNVVALLVRDDADAHRAVGIHSAAVDAATAGILLLFPFLGLQRRGPFPLCHSPVVLFPSRFGKVQRNRLFRRQAHRKRALRAIDPRIDQRIKFEFDAEPFLGETLHLKNLVLIDGRRYGL